MVWYDTRNCENSSRCLTAESLESEMNVVMFCIESYLLISLLMVKVQLCESFDVKLTFSYIFAKVFLSLMPHKSRYFTYSL
jgi:hypothetical protein